jgi:hypothetical protein
MQNDKKSCSQQSLKWKQTSIISDNSFINQKIIKIIEIYTPKSPHTSQETRSLGKEESSYTSLEDDPLFLTAAIIDRVHKAS